MKILYPETFPYHSFFLETDSQHQVYIEESGNPDGIPVIFLHGGPCSGTKPDHRRFFNPKRYRIVLMDQRGCGKSLPFGEIQHNTTQDLIDDIESLRQQLNIQQWLLFSGSWGATLALLYAQQYPQNVSGMIIRGVFLARQKDSDWFLEQGAGQIYPEQWQDLVESLPKHSQKSVIKSLREALWGDDELTQRRVAKAWNAWGGQVALGAVFKPNLMPEHVSEKMLLQVRMELHYAENHYFITENQILENCAVLSDIPTTIIHGRYDLVCPMNGAMALHQALPQADYHVLPHSGHIASDAEMIDALINATDYYAGAIV